MPTNTHNSESNTTNKTDVLNVDIPPESTRGIVCLASANYEAFEEVIDKTASTNNVDHVELRDAIATWVDHDINTADDAHTTPRRIIIEARDRCENAAQHQYPDVY